MEYDKSVICALSTGQTRSAIGLIRVSGDNTFEVISRIIQFKQIQKDLNTLKGYSLHRATIIENEKWVDDVLVSVFRAPLSYTGENMVEISFHGSIYLKQKILNLLILSGARLATAGEFTLRGFFNNKFSLDDAEAIHDLISSNDKLSHEMAIRQMRGGFKHELSVMRERLLRLVTLLELELDFSEEDVEFADRSELVQITDELQEKTAKLIASFEQGNAIKSGIPVAIVGKTNAGKSTLMNCILNDERSIVSDIPGTTRDVVEESFSIRGIPFRFADTAGFRQTSDEIETEGIKRTIQKILLARIVIVIADITDSTDAIVDFYKETLNKIEDQQIILLLNKTDLLSENKIPEKAESITKSIPEARYLFCSVKNNSGTSEILNHLFELGRQLLPEENQVIITNSRHLESLLSAKNNLISFKNNLLQSISSELLIQDLKEVLRSIGIITGEITNDEILGNIFKNFCIGK